jgi:hypothetical protein
MIQTNCSICNNSTENSSIISVSEKLQICNRCVILLKNQASSHAQNQQDICLICKQSKKFFDYKTTAVGVICNDDIDTLFACLEATIDKPVKKINSKYALNQRLLCTIVEFIKSEYHSEYNIDYNIYKVEIKESNEVGVLNTHRKLSLGSTISGFVIGCEKEGLILVNFHT